MRQRWDEFDNFRDCVDAAFAAYSTSGCHEVHFLISNLLTD